MARSISIAFGMWLLLSLPGCAQRPRPAPDATHIVVAGRDVALWKPSGPAPAAGYPVILFSHGLGGCNTQSVFLMEALARSGYLVLAPNHHDATCGSARGSGRWSGVQEPLGKPAEWSDATYRDRAADLRALLDAVLQDKSFQGVPVDPSRVGLAGHSLGGYTVLGVGGGWPSWKDDRVRAVLALSPYANPYTVKGTLAKMGVPVMYQSGTSDFGVDPFVKGKDGAYGQTSMPKYFVEFSGAGHLAWTDMNPKYQGLIDSYSVAFFDRYLKGQSSPDPLAPLFASPPAGVSSARADAR